MNTLRERNTPRGVTHLAIQTRRRRSWLPVTLPPQFWLLLTTPSPANQRCASTRGCRRCHVVVHVRSSSGDGRRSAMPAMAGSAEHGHGGGSGRPISAEAVHRLHARRRTWVVLGDPNPLRHGRHPAARLSARSRRRRCSTSNRPAGSTSSMRRRWGRNSAAGGPSAAARSRPGSGQSGGTRTEHLRQNREGGLGISADTPSASAAPMRPSPLRLSGIAG